MLKVPAPFPQVGSYAMFVDSNLPRDDQRAELVRIIRRPTVCDRGGDVAIALPLRIGASGNQVVDEADLLDATPLTGAEQRELTDLLNYIRARVRPDKTKMARAEALRSRLVMSDVMAIEQRKLAIVEGRTARRQGGSPGSLLPHDAEQAA